MKNILDRYIRYIFNEHNKSQFNQINLINLVNDYLIGVENTILLYNFKYVVIRFRREYIPLNFTKIHTSTTYIHTVNSRSINIDANKARNEQLPVMQTEVQECISVVHDRKRKDVILLSSCPSN